MLRAPYGKFFPWRIRFLAGSAAGRRQHSSSRPRCQLTASRHRDPDAATGGKAVDKKGATFLQRTIRMILFAFFGPLSVQKNICRSPLPTYNE